MLHLMERVRQIAGSLNNGSALVVGVSSCIGESSIMPAQSATPPDGFSRTLEIEVAAADALPPLALTVAFACAAAEAKLCCTDCAAALALLPPHALLCASAKAEAALRCRARGIYCMILSLPESCGQQSTA